MIRPGSKSLLLLSRALRVFGLCKFASSDAWTHSHLRVLNLPIYARHLLVRHLATPPYRSRVALASLHHRTAGDRNPSTTVPSLVSILFLCHTTEEERPDSVSYTHLTLPTILLV